MIWDALTLQLGYNATLVTLGATLLGMAAGVGGTFLFLRKRALVSDAISHATLPGVALAFMVMVAFGGDGRNLIGLLLGAALSAAAEAFFGSATPLKTALTLSKRIPTLSASSRAIVVLPVPGGPHRIILERRPAATIRPIAPSGPVRWC